MGHPHKFTLVKWLWANDNEMDVDGMDVDEMDEYFYIKQSSPSKLHTPRHD